MDAEELLRLMVQGLRSEKALAPERVVPSGQRLSTIDAVNVLKYRNSFFADSSESRSTLVDGRSGYRVRAEAQLEIIFGESVTDPKATRELIKMETREADVFIADPVLTLDGVMRVDLEILSFTLEGVSTKLTDKEVPIRMHCGRFRDKYMRKTVGRIEVPQGVEFGQVPVRVIHEVFVSIETPKGILHNKEPAIMMGFISKMPPVNERYEQVGHVDLYNEKDIRVAAKSTQTSFIRGLA